jgi:SAM-dependent methyltransferase
MSDGSTVDFGKTAADYAKHRQGFPDSLFDRLSPFGVGGPGRRVVDVGTGTGTLARGFAQRGAEVVGIDPSAPMLAEARRLAAADGLAVVFREGRAEATGLPDEWADAFTAGQCWHWFDRKAAASEAWRVLRSDGRGRIVICHFDWLSLRGGVAHATEELIRQHNPAWVVEGTMGIYPPWTFNVAGAGFTNVETFSYDVDAWYTHEAWRGRVRACAGVAASTLPPEKVEAFDADLAELLRRRFPVDPMPVLHRVWALVAVKPAT